MFQIVEVAPMKSTTSPKSDSLPVVLSIAGSDSGGGAGIQADLLTFAAFGTFGTTAITCLTAQNPDGVTAVEAMSPQFIREQIDQVAGYFIVKALKTGMLYDEGIITSVAEFLNERRDVPAVIDPVMVAASGATLLQAGAIEAVKEKLLPLAAVVTPNLDETRVLLGRCPVTAEEMKEAGLELASTYGTAFLVKGGHLESEVITDVLCQSDGACHVFETERVRSINTHGSGCTLSAAIAAGLARERSLPDAVRDAQSYLQRAMQSSLQLKDQRFIAHGV